MRASQLLLPTVKEDPAGAEAISHKLMVRAGRILFDGGQQQLTGAHMTSR